jgi:hypothetical protein
MGGDDQTDLDDTLRSYRSRWYNRSMNTVKTAPLLDQILVPLGDCLTPESARRLLALKADCTLQTRVIKFDEAKTTPVPTDCSSFPHPAMWRVYALSPLQC